MDNKICIVAATYNDIPAIQLTAHRIWHAHYPGIITREQIDFMLAEGYSADKIKTEMTEQGIVWLKIIDNETMIGFAAFGPCDASIIKLHKLYLDVSFHGKGFGAMALAEVERRATDAGATAIILNVNKFNNKAITSYQRNGYQITESVVNNIGSGFVMDDYVMKKVLLFK